MIDLLVKNLRFFPVLRNPVLFEALDVFLGPEVHKLVSKEQSPWLPDGENRMILQLLVLMHYQCVTDRWTDRWTCCLWLSHVAL